MIRGKNRCLFKIIRYEFVFLRNIYICTLIHQFISKQHVWSFINPRYNDSNHIHILPLIFCQVLKCVYVAFRWWQKIRYFMPKATITKTFPLHTEASEPHVIIYMTEELNKNWLIVHVFKLSFKVYSSTIRRATHVR